MLELGIKFGFCFTFFSPKNSMTNYFQKTLNFHQFEKKVTIWQIFFWEPILNIETLCNFHIFFPPQVEKFNPPKKKKNCCVSRG
jgi:hypothetical protein